MCFLMIYGENEGECDWLGASSDAFMWINFKSGQGDEAADSTDSTEPIHLVLQHLRESFSLS